MWATLIVALAMYPLGKYFEWRRAQEFQRIQAPAVSPQEVAAFLKKFYDELARERMVEKTNSKKERFKELMDKATTAYARGKYDECEAHAKRAMDIDPDDADASVLVYKAKMERRWKDRGSSKDFMQERLERLLRTCPEPL